MYIYIYIYINLNDIMMTVLSTNRRVDIKGKYFEWFVSSKKTYLYILFFNQFTIFKKIF